MRIYIDFKSPSAYLAMKPTLALIERLNLNVQWLPFITAQSPIPAEKPEETRGESHRRVRAIARRDTHLRYAAVQNIPMNFRETPGETDLALGALLFAHPSPLPFIQRAFASYWDEGRDLNDAEAITALLEDTGYDAGKFGADKYIAKIETVQQEAEERGVVDTVAYLISDQIFIGREHLPWIEELLTSGKG